MERPASIARFEQFYGAAVVVGLAGTAIAWNLPTTIAAREKIGDSLFIGSIAIGLIIPLLLWYFIARRGSPIAKWIFVVLTAIGVIGTLYSVTALSTGLVMPVQFGISVLGTLLQAVAGVMLFRPDANAWFNDGRGDGE